MAGIFSERNMLDALISVRPDGEKVSAGVHGVVKKVKAVKIFKNVCKRNGEGIVESEDTALKITKEKECAFDAYIGITENHLLIVECEDNGWLYDYTNIPMSEVEGIDEGGIIPPEMIGTSYAFSDITSCKIKKILMGAVNLTLTFKDGSYYKIMLPKLAGLGGGMPNHKQYRTEIIDRLSGLNIFSV